MIKRLETENIETVSSLALKLWPDADLQELILEFTEILERENDICYVLHYEEAVIGFIHASTRFDYVEGSEDSPVGYIEGIFIEEAFRKKGYSKQLVQAVEAWAYAKGYSELGSDCEIDNIDSIAFHKGVDFIEANRVVCFIKKIGSGKN